MKTIFTALLVIGSALILLWLFLLIAAGADEKLNAAYGNLVDNIMKTLIEKKKKKTRGQAKKIAHLEKDRGKIQSGNTQRIGVIPLAGLKLIQLLPSLTQTVLFTKLFTRSVELYGRKYALYKAKCLFATAISIALIGAGLSITIGSIAAASVSTNTGLMISFFGAAISVTYAYSTLDAIKAKAARRSETIVKQFPAVVSKLALLVCSGMIMDRAWKLTAFNKEGELYDEMRMTSDELEQNIAPDAAYGAFINRCNTKETAKLASAIMQNRSKGNAEIGELLREMAREAWAERRHNAKRDAEKANAKLIIPTILLFVSVLVIIMVPLALSMGNAL